jgi:hypothetical protein
VIVRAVFLYFLFALLGVVALAFTAGFYVKTASILLWIGVLSLHNRNPYVLDGGDRLLLCVLFWCMFLPIGDRCSVDNALSKAKTASSRDSAAASHHSFVGFASIALMVQIALFYWVSSVRKIGAGELSLVRI